jgi:hypothetical protein
MALFTFARFGRFFVTYLLFHDAECARPDFMNAVFEQLFDFTRRHVEELFRQIEYVAHVRTYKLILGAFLEVALDFALLLRRLVGIQLFDELLSGGHADSLTNYQPPYGRV